MKERKEQNNNKVKKCTIEQSKGRSKEKKNYIQTRFTRHLCEPIKKESRKKNESLKRSE